MNQISFTGSLTLFPYVFVLLLVYVMNVSNLKRFQVDWST